MEYPVQFSVDYPDRRLSRLSTALRIFWVLPIVIVLGTVSGQTWQATYSSGETVAAGAGGALFPGPLLMIMFRQKYPRWWFDWNLELGRFSSRVSVYLALMDDRYPSTDDHQSVHLDYPYPDAGRDLSRRLPLVKWLAAIPHSVVLLFLYIAAFAVVIMAWFAIVFTGTYPRAMSGFVEGVFRWASRVTALCVHPRHRPVPAVPAGPVTRLAGRRCPADQPAATAIVSCLKPVQTQ
jgi:hypothetical protein